MHLQRKIDARFSQLGRRNIDGHPCIFWPGSRGLAGFMNNPVTNLVDEAGFFDNIDQFDRRLDTKCRMLPPQQSFVSRNAIVAE